MFKGPSTPTNVTLENITQTSVLFVETEGSVNYVIMTRSPSTDVVQVSGEISASEDVQRVPLSGLEEGTVYNITVAVRGIPQENVGQAASNPSDAVTFTTGWCSFQY